ncbi:hypothetical protein Nmel_011236 [Mimus melanotis]
MKSALSWCLLLMLLLKLPGQDKPLLDLLIMCCRFYFLYASGPVIIVYQLLLR